jgi:hypothetical protein
MLRIALTKLLMKGSVQMAKNEFVAVKAASSVFLVFACALLVAANYSKWIPLSGSYLIATIGVFLVGSIISSVGLLLLFVEIRSAWREK